MGKLKYVIKRVCLMLFTLFVITTICFMLIRLLPRELPTDKNLQFVIKKRWEALGFYKKLSHNYSGLTSLSMPQTVTSSTTALAGRFAI